MLALVTGPGGFLGRYIVEQLLARGDSVRGLARGDYPELAAAGVEMISGDLADRDAVDRAVTGVDCVFHVAGKVGVWGRWFDYFRSNVHGTLNLLGACQDRGVDRLVFTSSPSVTFDGRHQKNVDESAPYPTKWLAHYPHSKAIAENFVLSVNGQPLADGRELRTCALRPHLVWGPRDHHLTARLIERARSGQLRRVGDGHNLVDTIYVENAAEAHLLAADALAEPDSPVAGNAYFLSQGDPVNCWQWIDDILALVDLPPVDRAISARKAVAAGLTLERWHWLTRNWNEPRMTRFVARSLSTHHYFNIEAAKRDFGYLPRVSTEAGMQRLGEWLDSDRGLRVAD
ncbi:3 beta-hydroxysteroid dehydrogenase/Delta 5--_4-isomerase [Posidoniimonas corsicana]|uniref:3 beta-hydroxysteroid dehydrogenase/Delta 5-->4-isomerase n=1 Tax=Posidoniimonas corsicana TaxID=1938618 RepID=A0A5C5VK17_9BACT|nr:NAD-dependent epimerase/dehydratase family protein [Posidoniimonas corsicana]TWT38052.1 3 beta-hydroxysteroid dehydrogenase/Delta 5-->4-isomerase [Posidoniimonas corsicana]